MCSGRPRGNGDAMLPCGPTIYKPHPVGCCDPSETCAQQDGATCPSDSFEPCPPGHEYLWGHCVACQPGYVYSEAADECVPCEAGFHQPVAGELQCLVCPLGAFSNTSGEANCTVRARSDGVCALEGIRLGCLGGSAAEVLLCVDQGGEGSEKRARSVEGGGSRPKFGQNRSHKAGIWTSIGTI